MIDIQELKNCQENNSIGYIVWALPQIIKEMEALREVAEAARQFQTVSAIPVKEENIEKRLKFHMELHKALDKLNETRQK